MNRARPMAARLIKIKNLNGPALSSHAERTGAEVDFLKHGGRVVKYRCFCELVTVWPQTVNGRRIIGWKTT